MSLKTDFIQYVKDHQDSFSFSAEYYETRMIRISMNRKSLIVTMDVDAASNHNSYDFMKDVCVWLTEEEMEPFFSQAIDLITKWA